MSITAIKERPILFSAPMVNAIQAGRKTMTRRIVKGPLPLIHDLGDHCGPALLDMCPHGKPGDRLWVRESLRKVIDTREDNPGPSTMAYAADNAHIFGPSGKPLHWGWARPTLPSIHMPRWASRITLEITDVRVERLNDISEADAIAEGVSDWWDRLIDSEIRRLRPRVLGFDRKYPIESGLISRKALFATLWESLHGKGSWAANDWLWAITFHEIDT